MESHNMTQVEDDGKTFSTRDGSLFIIDSSPDMFESRESHQSYFIQCLEIYQRILSQKLTWNRKDWMGLLLYNTKLLDDPAMKEIHTLQKFQQITTDMLIGILYMSEHQEDYYKKNAITSDKSLNDVLLHACRSFDSVKVSMALRQVILLTCRDNPLPENETERHKIRLRAKTYPDVNVDLQIIGLGGEWQHELFYKDIQALASNADPEDVKRTQLEDLEVQMTFPARISGRLNLQIGNDLAIRTFITSFSCTTKYLKRACMHKDTNEVLEVVKHWGPPQEWGEDSEDEEDDEIIKTRVPDTVEKAVNCGDKLIRFKPSEIRKIRVTKKPGINLIGFKPVSLDMSHHIKAARFLGVENTASKEEKQLFAAILLICKEKGLMAVCSVSHRSAPYLAKIIPCSKHGGFYLYKLAFREQINNLEEYTKSNIYDELPIDAEGVAILKKIIKKVHILWEPKKFSNPKLIAEMTYVEALALDRVAPIIIDSTLPDKATMVSRMSKVLERYENKFGGTNVGTSRKEVWPKRAAPRPDLDDEVLIKATVFEDEVIRKLVKDKELHLVSTKVLRAFGRTLGISPYGTREDLMKRIKDHYATETE